MTDLVTVMRDLEGKDKTPPDLKPLAYDLTERGFMRFSRFWRITQRGQYFIREREGTWP